jgi:hypothetical protein
MLWKKNTRGSKSLSFFWIGEIEGSNPLSIIGKAYINKVFVDLTGNIEQDRFSFVTTISQGFTYKFVGRFITGDKPVKDGKIHIQGNLMKLKGSRKIVSRKVEFFVGNGYNT